MLSAGGLVVALVAGVLAWVVARGDPDRAPFDAALDDLARAAAVGYRSTTAGDEVRVTASGFGVGTVTVSGRRLEVLFADGKGYLRTGDGVIPGASSDAAPAMVRGRWVTGDVPLAGQLPARFLTPKALERRLRSALDETSSFPADDHGGTTVGGLEVLAAHTPAGELDVTRAAPHRLVRFVPAVGQDVGVVPPVALGLSAPGPVAAAPVAGTVRFAGASPIAAGPRGPPGEGTPDTTVAATSIHSESTDPAGEGVAPLPPAEVDQTYDQLRREIPTLDGAAVDGGALKVDTDGKVTCSSAGCTVTIQVKASTAYTGTGQGDARLTGPVTVEMSAAITINGLGAGGCSTQTKISPYIAGLLACSNPGAGPVFVRADRIAQRQAAAGAAPGQYYRWTVESRADVHVLARAQIDVRRLVGQLDDQQAEAARNPDGSVRRIYGSQQGAEDLQKRAAALQQARPVGFPRNSGTTAVVRVQNKRTGEVQTWVATESSQPAPRGWAGMLDGLVYKQGRGHAEQTIIDALKANGQEEWQIIEGGVNRNVCIQTPTGACAAPLTARDITIGGQKYRYQGNKTDYRTFWWAGGA